MVRLLRLVNHSHKPSSVVLTMIWEAKQQQYSRSWQRKVVSEAQLCREHVDALRATKQVQFPKLHKRNQNLANPV